MRDLLEVEVLDHLDGAVAVLGGEGAREGQALHLPRQPLGVAARMRPEDDAAARVVRGARGSPGGPGRCPSGGTASCRRRRPRRGSSCRGCRCGARRAGRRRPGAATAVFTGAANSSSGRSIVPISSPVLSVESGRAAWRYAFLTMTRAFAAPGRTPERRRLRSASARTTVEPLDGHASWPMWPAIRVPLKTRARASCRRRSIPAGGASREPWVSGPRRKWWRLIVPGEALALAGADDVHRVALGERLTSSDWPTW